MDTRPNFLIFVTDQHRADHLGCYGNTVVRTPQIDALAAAGTRFERAYVANPVCMPNRGSMMTSRMPGVHGARGNGVPLPLDAVTFADVLAGAGYRTALIGKSHLQNMEDRPSLLPPRPVVDGVDGSPVLPEARRSHGADARYRQELRSSWERPDHRLTLPYYGFQEVVLCNHHADECFGDWLRWLRREQPELAARLGRAHGEADPRYLAPQAWRTHLDEDHYPSHYIAGQSAQWLHRHADTRAGEPFALVCSFPDPHHPWTPPGRYWDLYDPAAIPLPPGWRSDPDGPPHVRWLHDERRAGQANLEGPRLFAVQAREVREIIALTYGMITNIDDRIGLVMQALRETGADRDTVVVFTSDHGDLMGDHGIVLKGPLHYQGLVRVPLIWREPRAVPAPDAAVRTDLVSSIDLGVSVLQRAGLAAPNGVQGRALFTPRGEAAASRRDAVLIEENQQRAYLGFTGPVRARTLVTDRHRLTLFVEGRWGELYDLAADPQERVNLWDDPAAAGLKSTLLERLAQLMIEHADESPRPTHLA